MNRYIETEVTTVPFTIKETGKPDIIVDETPNSLFPKIYEFFQKYAYESHGVGKNEVVDLSDFILKCSKGINVYIREAGTEKIVGFVMLYDSPLIRSVKPVHCAGYRVRHPDYKGYTPMVIPAMKQKYIEKGYVGFIGRSSVLNYHAFLGMLSINTVLCSSYTLTNIGLSSK